MARPILIIEFSHSTVRAGVYPRAGSAPSAYFTLPSGGMGVREAVSAVLSEAAGTGKADVRASDIFVSVPPSSAILRVVEVPVGQRDKINEILPFELAGVLSVDVDDVVVDNIPAGAGRAIAVALEKKVLSEYLEAFRAANADPVWVGVAGFSVPSFLYGLEKTPGTVAFVREDFMSVSREGVPVFFNSYSGPGGLRLSLKYLEAEGVAIDAVRYEGINGEEITALFPGVPSEEVEVPGGLTPDAIGIAAVADEVSKGDIGETVNFRKGEFENTREKSAFKRKLRFTFVLLAATALFVAGDFYVRYLTLGGELAAYKKAMRASYTGLFPGEKSPADELYQLSVKLKAIEQEAEVVNGGPGVLDLLESLSVAASKDPDARIRVNEISMAEGRIRASGEAASFDAANRFKESLAGNGRLKNVQLTDLKSKTGGGAAFSLSMTVL